MLKKILFTTAAFLGFGLYSWAQQDGALKVTVTDKESKETLPFAAVVAEMNGVQVASGQTDFDGELEIKPLTPGTYDVKVTIVGYQPLKKSGVIVSANKTTYLNIAMAQSVQVLKEIVFVEEKWEEPLIDPDTKSGGTVTKEEYQNMAVKNVNSVAAQTAGVTQADEGSSLNMRGQRAEGTEYYVDGVRMQGGTGAPQLAVEQVSTITGGVPAQYGDATGGIISITTSGPSSQYFGSVEMISSQFLDPYGYNSLGFSTGGPLYSVSDSIQGKRPVLGFILSGQASAVKDGNPSAVGAWNVKDDVLTELEENPLRINPYSNTPLRNAEFVTMDDLEHVKAKQNVASRGLSLNGKIDFKPTRNFNITLGGSMDYSRGHSWVYLYSLFNPVNNPLVTSSTYRGFMRITQKFGNATPKQEEKSSAIIKNAYYSILASYTKTLATEEDDTHKDRYFDYGYIGKFHQYKGEDPNDPSKWNIVKEENGPWKYYQRGYTDTLLTFEPGDKNTTATNWTEQYYDIVGANNVYAFYQVQQGLGLMNGDRPSNIYSMWYNTGRQYGGYTKSDNSFYRVFTSFNADIGKHAINMGFEYEQRDYRSFFVSSIGLWTLMRQLANYHLSQPDTSNPIYLSEFSGSDKQYYGYDRLYDASSQRQFDKSLREALGKPVDGTEWLDIDSYDPSTFSLDMFSADDLLNDGSSYVSYYGYDHTGKKLKNNPSFDDFFTKKDDKGNFNRSIGAYQPIYTAAYIEDKFDIKDLKVRAGVRVDRFDNNQPVLKDKYSLFETRKAGEVTNFGAKPANIGDDYVVYVDDIKNPTKIVGYRNEDTWYNAEGAEISDPSVLAKATTSGANVAPYLLDPNDTKIGSKAFKDYDPQVNFMPRLAFSFPISEQANFFAHYDVLTQRPSGSQIMPTQYMYIQNSVGALMPNGDLQPQRTTDYELGFSQVLNEKKNSVLTLTAFYRELRNMTQAINVNYAYPITYKTFGNIDFGTVKGFSGTYELRRTGGISMTTNYTLQFADGTGSSATSGFNLLNTNQPNLRTTIPLAFDQRHTIVMNFDYRFGQGLSYNGPVWVKGKGSENEKGVNILNGMGANLTLTANSGTPYTQQSTATPDALFGVSTRSTLKGTLNGSRKPWNTRMDLRIDKYFDVKYGKKSESTGQQRVTNVNIYLQVLNVLNAKNVLGVYPYTGNAFDDGYLSAEAWQSQIASQNNPQSYTDLYNVKVNSPSNYTMPRRIRLGVIVKI